MGAEVVVLHHAAPMCVDHGRPLVARADAVHPMVLVGKTAARPAHDRHLDFAQGIDHIGADAAHVGNLGILADPVSFVDTAPQMFGKMAVDIAVDFCLGNLDVQRDLVHWSSGILWWNGGMGYASSNPSLAWSV